MQFPLPGLFLSPPPSPLSLPRESLERRGERSLHPLEELPKKWETTAQSISLCIVYTSVDFFVSILPLLSVSPPQDKFELQHIHSRNNDITCEQWVCVMIQKTLQSHLVGRICNDDLYPSYRRSVKLYSLSSSFRVETGGPRQDTERNAAGCRTWRTCSDIHVVWRPHVVGPPHHTLDMEYLVEKSMQ